MSWNVADCSRSNCHFPPSNLESGVNWQHGADCMSCDFWLHTAPTDILWRTYQSSWPLDRSRICSCTISVSPCSSWISIQEGQSAMACLLIESPMPSWSNFIVSCKAKTTTTYTIIIGSTGVGTLPHSLVFSYSIGAEKWWLIVW